MGSNAQRYYKEVSSAFNQASDLSTSKRVRNISLNEHHIRLEFTEPGLDDRLFAALAHLQCPAPGKPDLVIKVWETEKSGIEFPFPPPDIPELEHGSHDRWGINLRSSDTTAIKCFYSPWPNQYFCIFNPLEQIAIWWRPNGYDIPYFEQGSPLLPLFEWWLARHNLILTHGAAVGTAQGAAMIIGRGGLGKSTSAISCLVDDAMYYISDDYFALSPGRHPVAMNLFQTGKLDENNLRTRFPQLARLTVNTPRPGDDKCLFFPGRHFQDRLCLRLPVKIAILPMVADVDIARLLPSQPNELMRGFAASTLYQSTSGGAKTLRALIGTLASLPCYTMQIGSDLRSIPRCIREGIAEHV